MKRGFAPYLEEIYIHNDGLVPYRRRRGDKMLLCLKEDEETPEARRREPEPTLLFTVLTYFINR